MPVSNPTPLPDIAFSRNQLNLEVSSDDYQDAAPAYSVNYLEFSAAVADGDNFGLSWNRAAASMTAKDAPDDSGLQFPTGDGLNAYVTSLLDWFNGNPFISGDYVLSTNFTGAHPRIIFTAKGYGPDYDFTAFLAGAAGNITPGVTDEPKTNFMHHVELWIGNATGDGFDKAFDANVPLDYPLTGKTTIDIHDALHDFLSNDMPELAAAYAYCSNSIRPYYFRMAQFYGDSPSVQKIKKSNTYFINKGGMSVANAAKRTLDQELTPPGDATKRRFLRQGSVNKLISTEQPEWLTWINLTGDDQSVTLEVTIYNDDATSAVFNSVTDQAVTAWQKIQFQTGYTQMNIPARQALKTPVYYSVALKNADGYLTPAYTYVIDYTYRPWPRYFVYENSYGAFQTIGTVGKGLAEYDRTKDDSQLVVNQNTAAVDGEFLETSIRIQEKGTVAVGYDRAGTRNTRLIRDFVLSDKKYLWQDGDLVPIGISTDNIKDAPDGMNIYASSFQYYPLYKELAWSEDQGLADDPINQLLSQAGSPAAGSADDSGSLSGIGSSITVQAGDIHLSVDGDGHLVYTAPILIGKTGYTVQSTQLANIFRPAEISYDDAAGSFTILIDGFAIEPGEVLTIFPFVLNPDA